MPASSLIFVVIIAVWAVYLIQHWIRRRDHVATARSVDRFSEAMRVLERRQRLPRVDSSGALPRSSVLALARPAHPEVVVKRAQPAVSAPRRRPVPVTGADRAATRPARSGAATQDQGLASGRAPSRRQPSTGAGAVWRRAMTLVVGALLMASGVGLAVLSLLPWWSVVLGVGMFLAALAHVRSSVAVSPRAATSRPRPQVPSAPVPGSSPLAEPAPQTTLQRGAVGSSRTGAPRPAVPYDVEAVEAVESARAAVGAGATPTAGPVERITGASAEPAPGTWQPVPVPPPAYTLKARAPRPHTAPRAAGASSAAGAPTPVGELPLDGNALALAEEFEELPAVHGVG